MPLIFLCSVELSSISFIFKSDWGPDPRATLLRQWAPLTVRFGRQRTVHDNYHFLHLLHSNGVFCLCRLKSEK